MCALCSPRSRLSTVLCRLLTLSMIAVSVLAAGACTPKPAGPGAAAEGFLAAFAAQKFDVAARATDQPAKAKAMVERAWRQLQAERLVVETGTEKISGDTGTVDYTYEWHLPKNRVWKYTGTLQMGRRDGRWSVRWAASDIHPTLGDNQSMALRTTAAPKARVNERAGGDVLAPGVLHAVMFDTDEAAAQTVSAADQLAAILTRFDGAITGQSIVESATATKGKYRAMLLRQDDFDDVAEQLSVLPGVSFVDQADLVPTDRDFAPDLIAQVRKTVINEVDGKAGWSVVTVNPNGVDTDVLTETAPQPVPSFSISLDRGIQNSAQRAVDGARDQQAMMIVLQPSTGAILAVAQNKAADKDGPLATTGRYPPGSTFKMITAGAAIAGGLATPSTPVPCPGHIEIGERTVPNYDEFALGTVPMATAFARSCNTSFAKLASEMAPDALHTSAARLGFVQDYAVAGLPTASGSVPPARDLVMRTEDGFGQGKVLATPFAMAIAAATVAHGSTLPVPFLIAGRETKVKGDRPPVGKSTIDGLRTMMRLVVTNGTAERIADQGEVFGKTGEAEFPGGSHAWFAGYRGDLAFATLVVNGGSSDYAVALTRDMLVGLPAGG